jgi:hypothetical protein
MQADPAVVQMLLDEPRIAEALREVAANPATLQQYRDDPLVRSLIPEKECRDEGRLLWLIQKSDVPLC